MTRKLLLALCLFSCVSQFAHAQAQNDSRKLLYDSRAFFVPHWYVKAQGGIAYDIGEAKFDQLVSPGLQLVLGYKFTQAFGVRGSLSGLWARNSYAYPQKDYKWNFLMPAIEAEIDLTTLALGNDPERKTSLYAFAGAGAAYTYGNEDAEDAQKTIYGVGFQKLWSGSRWNPAIRAGLGIDYHITDEIAIGAEVNASMLPDHFNSKIGKSDNKDWHFNGLVGIKFTIGKSHGRTEAVYEEPQVVAQQPQTRAVGFVDVPIEKISFNVNVYFLINQSIIRDNQLASLDRLMKYLNEHPRAFIRLSGYADKETGTPEINMRLSRERAQAVSKYLHDRGIEEWRIRRFAKGDKVQPFDIPEDNRVCICYVYDPDDPKYASEKEY